MQNNERNSILCPNCRKLISRDEPSCPYCGLKHPGSRWKSNFWTGGGMNADQFIKTVIYVNVGMFVLSILISPRSAGLSLNPFEFLSPGNGALRLLGETGVIPIDRYGRYWTLLTANYLHGSVMHILFNMIAFSQLAPLIFQEFGGYRTFAIYTLSGVGGYVASYFAGIPLTLGASASVCGLLGAAMYYGKSRGGRFGQMVYSQVSGWVVGLVLFGLFFPGINNWAHGGGLVFGALTAFLMGYNERSPENFAHKAIAGVCLIATIAALLRGAGGALLLLLLS